MDDKRDVCRCHRECVDHLHDCSNSCIWPGCLTEDEQQELSRIILEESP